jgi:DNA-binding response OmpR family regulator
MKKVLLVEDDLILQNLINEYLEEYGYLSSAFANPIDALDAFKENPDDFTIVILDLGLPNMDGFDLFKKLKQIKDIPIIISTARDDIGNKIYGFELGTDDYLSKPYEPRELVLRIEATLKRHNKTDLLQIQELSIDISGERVFLSDVEIELTKIEKEIFLLFVNNLNKIISREDIVNQTSLKYDTKNRTVDTHISNIRYKIGDDSKEPKYIKSVWGIGYKFFYDN